LNIPKRGQKPFEKSVRSHKGEEAVKAISRLLISAVLALIALPTPIAAAETGDMIAVANLDAILKDNPLHPGGHTASIVASLRAGDAELGILVMTENRLHHHPRQDHVLYLVRGRGVAWLENASGQIETRAIEPGHLFRLPRGKKHGFAKAGDEDLVFLVVATPLPDASDQDTVYHHMKPQ
jgi:mannose-6-phosphate isomerase-like protein (cupin superfamily)